MHVHALLQAFMCINSTLTTTQIEIGYYNPHGIDENTEAHGTLSYP